MDQQESRSLTDSDGKNEPIMDANGYQSSPRILVADGQTCKPGISRRRTRLPSQGKLSRGSVQLS